MALISFINKKTYEITDELEDYIYCDYELRYIIRELNRKGYKTSFSCAGHNQIGLLLDLHKSPIGEINEYLEACKTDSSLHFISKDAEYFYHKYERVCAYTYIWFDDDYKFNKVPKDFAVEIVDGKSYISKKIQYYKDEANTIRKTDKEIFDELEQTHNDLKKWVDELENINL